MSVEQYQRTVNSLDKEIADLEKKKATADIKSAGVQKEHQIGAKVWYDKTQIKWGDSIIASKLAMSTATMTPKEIANELVKLLPDKLEKELV